MGGRKQRQARFKNSSSSGTLFPRNKMKPSSIDTRSQRRNPSGREHEREEANRNTTVGCILVLSTCDGAKTKILLYPPPAPSPLPPLTCRTLQTTNAAPAQSVSTRLTYTAPLQYPSSCNTQTYAPALRAQSFQKHSNCVAKNPRRTYSCAAGYNNPQRTQDLSLPQRSKVGGSCLLAGAFSTARGGGGRRRQAASR